MEEGMDAERSRRAALAAGAAAGVAGLLVFLVIHHLWILPIWFVAPVGGLVAILGGLTVGAAYHELVPHLPRRPWTEPAVVGLIALILLPAFVMAQLRGPVFELRGPDDAVLVVSPAEAGFAFAVDLLASATLVGASLGWLSARTRRAAMATAAAAFVFALGPGHNIPFLGGTSGVPKELVLIGASVTVAAVVLVEGHARLVRRWAVGPSG
jgi:MFS family permease